MVEMEEEENLIWLTEAYKDFKDRICSDYLISSRVNDFESFSKQLEMI